LPPCWSSTSRPRGLRRAACSSWLAGRARTGDEFVLYEKYVDEDAFDSHRKTPHFVAYIQGEVIPLLIERIWQRYDEVSPAPE